MIRQESEEQNTKLEPDMTDKEQPGDLEQAFAAEKEKAEQYLANWQRTQADFANYKRRTEQEKEELGKFANSVLIINLLSVLDDMERAIASLPAELAEDNWVNGIKIIENKFRTNLESQGVSPIAAIGEVFDPHLHEAVRQDTGKEGIILEEMQKGYMFHDRVLRPSKVIVGNGETEK